MSDVHEGQGAQWRDEMPGVAAAEAPEGEVRALLRTTKDGTPRGTVGNAIDILTMDSRWRGRLRLDSFSGFLEVRDAAPDGAWREAVETDPIRIAHWIERVYDAICPSGLVWEAMQAIAYDNQVHPVRAYLEGLRWDGVARIEGFLSQYIGAEDTVLNREISACFLCSGVARIYQPGVKVDTVLILVGDQGRHKSTAFRTLASAKWFADTKINPGDKDAYQALPGRWMYELAEMETWGARAWGVNKAFVSSGTDTYRPSFGRITRAHPRQTIFVGSTNVREFLADPTGERRWWPVPVGEKIDIAKLAADRDQLWAEAVAAYKAGRKWWLPPELEQAQADAAQEFKEHDAWEVPVASWVHGRVVPFSIFEVAKGALEIQPRDLDKRVQGRLADALRAVGCVRAGRESKPGDDGRRMPLWKWGVWR